MSSARQWLENDRGRMGGGTFETPPPPPQPQRGSGRHGGPAGRILQQQQQQQQQVQQQQGSWQQRRREETAEDRTVHEYGGYYSAARPPPAKLSSGDYQGRGLPDGKKFNRCTDLYLTCVPSDWSEAALIAMQEESGVDTTTIRDVKLLAQKSNGFQSPQGVHRAAIVCYTSHEAAQEAMDRIKGQPVCSADGSYNALQARFAEQGGASYSRHDDQNISNWADMSENGAIARPCPVTMGLRVRNWRMRRNGTVVALGERPNTVRVLFDDGDEGVRDIGVFVTTDGRELGEVQTIRPQIGMRVRNSRNGRMGTIYQVANGGDSLNINFDDGQNAWRESTGFEAEDGRFLSPHGDPPEGGKAGHYGRGNGAVGGRPWDSWQSNSGWDHDYDHGKGLGKRREKGGNGVTGWTGQDLLALCSSVQAQERERYDKGAGKGGKSWHPEANSKGKGYGKGKEHEQDAYADKGKGKSKSAWPEKEGKGMGKGKGKEGKGKDSQGKGKAEDAKGKGKGKGKETKAQLSSSWDWQEDWDQSYQQPPYLKAKAKDWWSEWADDGWGDDGWGDAWGGAWGDDGWEEAWGEEDWEEAWEEDWAEHKPPARARGGGGTGKGKAADSDRGEEKSKKDKDKGQGKGKDKDKDKKEKPSEKDKEKAKQKEKDKDSKKKDKDVEEGKGKGKGKKGEEGKGEVRKALGKKDPPKNIVNAALREVASHLRRPNCEGRVWIPNWPGRYQAQLGHLREFLELHPDKFTVVLEEGKQRRYKVQFANPAHADGSLPFDPESKAEPSTNAKDTEKEEKKGDADVPAPGAGVFALPSVGTWLMVAPRSKSKESSAEDP